MSKQIEGVIARTELGPGVFVLEGADGQRYTLDGGDDDLYQVGQRVAVEGTVQAVSMGIAMSGDPVLTVQKYSVVS